MLNKPVNDKLQLTNVIYSETAIAYEKKQFRWFGYNI